MQLPISEKSVVVFDLDDTLYPEEDFVLSGIRHLDRLLSPLVNRRVGAAMQERFYRGEEFLNWALKEFALGDAFSLERLLEEYRTHEPGICLPNSSAHFLQQLEELGTPTALITDGRSVTQRNKLRALGLSSRFDLIVVSEECGSAKPDPRNYQLIEERWPRGDFTYIADNLAKDFIEPIRRGWRTVCVRDHGRNIHRQDLDCATGIDLVVNDLAQLQPLKAQGRGSD